jgi:hypothetical protein
MLGMRWFLLAAAVAFVAFLYWQSTAERVSYVNGLPEYSSLPGREYFLERDCFLFKFRHQNSDWPLIGCRDTVPALPESVAAKYIGADLPDVRILDLVKAGTRFRIVSVRRTASRTKSSISFEILLGDEVSFRYPRVDAFWILDHSPEAQGKAPRVMTDYAVPRFKY